MAIVTVKSKYQVVIPQSVRDEISVPVGDVFEGEGREGQDRPRAEVHYRPGHSREHRRVQSRALLRTVRHAQGVPEGAPQGGEEGGHEREIETLSGCESRATIKSPPLIKYPTIATAPQTRRDGARLLAAGDVWQALILHQLYFHDGPILRNSKAEENFIAA
jgi:bifunctional DNA-binding transcriptional regulator/antitoxin component of YhaV-PrlF toxin-antitoxin module